MFVMQSPFEDYQSESTEDDKARSKEIRKPLLASLALIQTLLNRCVELVPLDTLNFLYSQSDLTALAVILQHDATNELVAMLAHYAYWHLYGHQASERLVETKVDGPNLPPMPTFVDTNRLNRSSICSHPYRRRSLQFLTRQAWS